MGYQMRGSRVRGRRRKYRVGAQTVNFASLGLVASALVVVVEITAPSSAPPGVFASASQSGRAASPGLPLDTTAPAAVRALGPQVSLGGLAPTSLTSTSLTSTSRLASSIEPAPTLSHSAAFANPEVLTSAVPAVLQRSHSAAEAAKRSPADVGSRTHGNGADNSSGNGSGNSSALAQVAVVSATAGPDLSPNVTVGVGNGNGANGAVSHGNGPPLKSQATSPAQPSPPVSSHGIGASAPPGQGAGAGHGSH